MARSRSGTWARLAAKLAICGCVLGMAQAKPPVSQETAVGLGRDGVTLLESGRPQDALEKFDAALTMWRELGSVQGQAAVAGKIGEAEQALGRSSRAIRSHIAAAKLWTAIRIYDSAIRQYTLAFQIAGATKDVAMLCDALGGLGQVQLATGNLGFASESLKDAATVCDRDGDPEATARARAALGDLYTRQGRYDEALTVLGSAVDLQVADRSITISIRKNLGVLYSRQARFDDAQRELERARTLAGMEKDQETEGLVVAALGRTYFRLGRYGVARTRYDEAVELLGEGEVPLNTGVARGLRPLLARALSERGEVHLAERNPELAEQDFRTALSWIFADSKDAVVLRGGSDRRMVDVEGVARYGLATALMSRGDHEGALEQLQSVLTIARDLGDLALEGRVLSLRGVALHATGKLNEAARSFQTALGLQNRIGDIIGETATLQAGATLDREQQRYPQAIERLRRAVDLLEEVRGSIEASESRIGFLGAGIGTTELMIDLLVGLSRAETPPVFNLPAAGTDYASAALHYVERSRAREWVNAIGRMRGAGLDLPEQLATAERSLIARRDDELRRFRELAGDRRTAGERYRTATNELRQFVEQLRTHPDPAVRAYATLRYPEPLRAAEIQKALRPDEILIEYSIRPSGAVLWVVEPGKPVQLLPISLSFSEITELVRLVHTAYRYEFTIPQAAVERLYDALLAPALKVAATGKRLIIVPDGPLLSLPFEALGSKSASGWRFVDDDRIVSYYPSATLVALARLNESRRRWSGPLFAMGDPVYQDGSDFQRLEATRTELAGIATVLGVTTPSDAVKLGVDASESAIKRASDAGRLADYRYVHLATHGVLGGASTPGGEPALVLSRESDGTDDGFLTMSEVLGLRVTADLVVLSACQSALGDVVPGEGVVGLMRAFFHAGTPSAVVSLWNVADLSTPDLMRRFYAGLARAPTRCPASDKACALNEARRGLRAVHPHPYYWAPFVLFGER